MLLISFKGANSKSFFNAIKHLASSIKVFRFISRWRLQKQKTVRQSSNKKKASVY